MKNLGKLATDEAAEVENQGPRAVRAKPGMPPDPFAHSLHNILGTHTVYTI